VDRIADDVSELKHRMTSLEGCYGASQAQGVLGRRDGGPSPVSMDKLEARLERIERRLDWAILDTRPPLGLRLPPGSR
jgi:hypothetical protein